MIELKPCPFCGSTDVRVIGDWFKKWVQCQDCCAHSGLKDDKEEAAKAWNRRASDEQVDI